MLQNFIVEEVVGGAMGVGNPGIRGFYTDDTWADIGCAPNMTAPVPTCGPTEMDPYAVIDMGLQPAEVSAIKLGWQRTMLAAQQKMLSMKAYTWQLLNCPSAPNLTHTCQQAPETAPGRDRCNPATGSTEHTPPTANCTQWMRRHCGPADDLRRSSFHRLALFFGFTRYAHHGDLDPAGHFPALFQDLATFLCVRGPYAWLGTGWVGCGKAGMYTRPAALDVDYGHPVGDCEEVGDEIFARQYSKANVLIDCRNFTATIEMTAGPHKGEINPGGPRPTPRPPSPPSPVPAALRNFGAAEDHTIGGQPPTGIFHCKTAGDCPSEAAANCMARANCHAFAILETEKGRMFTEWYNQSKAAEAAPNAMWRLWRRRTADGEED
jgi:hypothetical protein